MLDSDSSFSSFKDGILSWLEASGFYYKCNNDNEFNILIMQFDMGKNWSLFFKTYMQLVLKYYRKTDSQCEMTNNTVIDLSN